MGDPYVGHGACLGFGRESTWGTEVARSAWLRVNSTELKRSIEKVRRRHLGTHGATYYSPRGHFTAQDNAGGSFEVPMAYDDFSVALLVYAFGGVTDGGSGPSSYTHTIVVADPGQVGLTIEQINGTGAGEQFEGNKINVAELSIEEGGEMALRCEIVGQTSAGLESAGTPSFPTSSQVVLHTHAGQLTYDSVARDLVSFRLRHDRKLGRRGLLGSALSAQHVTTEMPETTCTVVMEYESTTYNAKYLTEVSSDITITFTGASGASMAMTLHNPYITDIRRSINNVGAIREEVDFAIEANASESGVSIVVTNDNANWYDNG